MASQGAGCLHKEEIAASQRSIERAVKAVDDIVQNEAGIVEEVEQLARGGASFVRRKTTEFRDHHFGVLETARCSFERGKFGALKIHLQQIGHAAMAFGESVKCFHV